MIIQLERLFIHIIRLFNFWCRRMLARMVRDENAVRIP